MTRKILMLLLLAATARGATYYVDPNASGSNNGSDWTNAWEALASAGDTAVAGDLVYVKGGTYTVEDAGDLLTIANTGTSTAPICLIGDDGAGNAAYVTLDAQDSLAACIEVTNFTELIHFRLWGSTGTPVIPTSADYVTLKDCIIENCGDGLSLDNNGRVIQCLIRNNTGSNGCTMDTLAQVHDCEISNNTGPELSLLDNFTVTGTLIYDDEAAELMYWPDQTGGKTITNCTFDGLNKTNLGTGIKSVQTAFSFLPTVINTSFTRLGTACDFTADVTDANTIFINCGWHDNTSNGVNISTGQNPITDAITFAGAGDYTPGTGSAALAAGIDANSVAGGTSYIDLGAIQVQSTEAGDPNAVALTPSERTAIAAAVWAHANAPTVASGSVYADMRTIEGTDATNVLNALDPVVPYLDPNGRFPSVVSDISGSAGVVTLANMFNTDTGTTYSAAVTGSLVKEIADNAAGGDGSGLTAIPWPAAWDAEVQSEVSDALTAYSPSTFDPNAEPVTLASTSKSGLSLAANQSGVTIGTVSTLTGHTPQTGDSYARLGTPANGSIAADIAAVDASGMAATDVVDGVITVNDVLEMMLAYMAGRVTVVDHGTTSTVTFYSRDGSTVKYTFTAANDNGQRTTTGTITP